MAVGQRVHSWKDKEYILGSIFLLFVFSVHYNVPHLMFCILECNQTQYIFPAVLQTVYFIIKCNATIKWRTSLSNCVRHYQIMYVNIKWSEKQKQLRIRIL